ncbi:MAG TPA: hypothetical protein VMS08_05840, partial [Candidatus Saccharimonadia bacterium]|nr:hypothetical protein [Candidatus Saccharimonadia bacterium]
ASKMSMTSAQMGGMQASSHSGVWFIPLLVLVQASIGIVAFWPGWPRKIALCTGIVVSLVFWTVGQSFGGIFTGLATDPGTAPLVILLALAIWPAPLTLQTTRRPQQSL